LKEEYETYLFHIAKIQLIISHFMNIFEQWPENFDGFYRQHVQLMFNYINTHKIKSNLMVLPPILAVRNVGHKLYKTAAPQQKSPTLK